MNSNRDWPISGVLFALIILAGISILVRWDVIWNRPLSGYLNNEDATSHVLATNVAYGETPWKVHHFLPIFTLGAPINHYIDDLSTASVQDRFGNYYYTSFPPLFFITPYLLEKVMGLPPSPIFLRWFDISLQFLTATLMGLFIYRCLKETVLDRATCFFAAGCTAIIYLSAPECLKSHSLSFWGQQLYAPLLIVQLALFIYRPSLIPLLLIAFLAGLLEWTAYLTNGCMVLLALISFYRSGDKRALYIAITLMAATLAAVAALVFWYSLIASPERYFSALSYRSGVRSGTFHSIFRLMPGYIKSLGAFTLIIIGALCLRFKYDKQIDLFLPRKSSRIIFPTLNPLVIVLIVISFAMMENLLLAQHAWEYTYDRLKAVQLAAFILGWAICINRSTAIRYLWYSFAVGLFSCGMFWITYDEFEDFQSANYQMHHRLGEIVRKTAAEDIPAFTNSTVRGAELFYAGRNIQEVPSSNELDEGAYIRKWCDQHGMSRAMFYDVSPNKTTVKVLLYSKDQPATTLGTFSLGHVEIESKALTVLKYLDGA